VPSGQNVDSGELQLRLGAKTKIPGNYDHDSNRKLSWTLKNSNWDSEPKQVLRETPTLIPSQNATVIFGRTNSNSGSETGLLRNINSDSTAHPWFQVLRDYKITSFRLSTCHQKRTSHQQPKYTHSVQPDCGCPHNIFSSILCECY